MAEITIDGKTAVDLLKKVVTFKGEDYVYQEDRGNADCIYMEASRTPSCMVGYVLIEAGVPVDTLYAVDHNPEDLMYDPETETRYTMGDTGIDGHEVPVYLNNEGVHLTDDAIAILGAAQRAQDNGGTWGEALRRAESIAL